MERIYSLIGAVTLGGALGYLGFMLFSGTPAFSGNRKAQMFLQVQDWLISKLGMTNAGLLLMGLGAAAAIYFIWAAFSSDDEEKV
ncbi:hypothetical protein [Parasulfitobacter algicola]|uniref:Uncharacterized protein n=1 Tax=Parasulfitobacter algicola TaxID=2614809 RepID=A0ABX2ITD0_9RHOB|nr:hypothetical protein [Sulfitobacter algicola]NSX53619.1 hypothetical protein [Sulfitobacter algicola]